MGRVRTIKKKVGGEGEEMDQIDNIFLGLSNNSETKSVQDIEGTHHSLGELITLHMWLKGMSWKEHLSQDNFCFYNTKVCVHHTI